MVLNCKELEKNLAFYAVKSSKSLGRKFKEKEDNNRLCFQKDKDRIVHCKAFRRLDNKTQVLISGSGDHFRTRLTHTLEVAQISRDIARRLGLNEDLCEAIALAHDLGHPPFGHGGEETLDKIMQKFSMHFEHNEQSRRIVEKLEKSYPNFDGLNLTFEVLDGLIKHKTVWDQSDKIFKSSSLEAQVVNIADEIAYTNHDLDDGLRASLITLKNLSKIKLWKNALEKVLKKYGKISDNRVLIPRTISALISIMIDDLCEQTSRNIKKKKFTAEFGSKMRLTIRPLRVFLYDEFYMNPKIHKFVLKGENMIKKLFNFYLKNPKKFPKTYKFQNKKEFVIAVKDYISGMTDGFLVQEFKRLC